MHSTLASDVRTARAASHAPGSKMLLRADRTAALELGVHLKFKICARTIALERVGSCACRQTSYAGKRSGEEAMSNRGDVTHVTWSRKKLELQTS